MANELLTILQYIEQERGISRESLIQALESAILTGAHKSIHPASELQVKIEPTTGQIRAWATLEVVSERPNYDQLALERAKERYPDAKVGDKVQWEVTPQNFGRIAAQTARQAILTQLRRVEKENVQAEFSDRVGQIINGTIRRFEAGNVIIDFQKAEGIMPSKEKIHDEQYMQGDIIRTLLLRVDTNTSGPSLIVSRACPEFVTALFKREIVEIRDGVVKIMGIAREPGKRTKIAVMSTDSRIDPVGACVGMRGQRVKNITNELGNERIDIVPYNSDICKYAINALQPAKVQSVEVNEAKHELTVRVTDEQSKLAFGKKAQNVRLCSKLIGWNITIRNESMAKGGDTTPSISEQLKKATAQLANDAGISEKTASLLVNNGYVTVDGLKVADPSALLEIEGIDAKEIQDALDRLKD